MDNLFDEMVVLRNKNVNKKRSVLYIGSPVPPGKFQNLYIKANLTSFTISPKFVIYCKSSVVLNPPNKSSEMQKVRSILINHHQQSFLVR